MTLRKTDFENIVGSGETILMSNPQHGIWKRTYELRMSLLPLIWISANELMPTMDEN